MKKTRLADAGVLLLCGLLIGCADVSRGIQEPKGVVSVVRGLGARSSHAAVPVERFSNGAGEIFGASAEIVGPRRTLVFGRLRNPLGVSDVRDAHIDVRLLGSDRRLIAAWTTDYFPRPILPEARGQPSRAFFCIQLPMAPAAGSIIQVVFHSSRLSSCAFSHPVAATGKP